MFRYERKYTGKLQGVILDWAGTTIDYGCFAPTMVFVAGFRAHGVDITLAEAREPMGKFKRDHIATVMQMPRVAQAWQAVHRKAPSDDDVQTLFDEFIPRQLEVLAQYATPIDGVIETIGKLRERGIKIGSCTGYTRAMMDIVIYEASKHGYTADAVVTFDDVGAGRPTPFMAFENCRRLNLYPMPAVVKIGDTVVDIEEGLNANMWTIGIAKTGNEVGMSAEEIATSEPTLVQTKLDNAYRKLYQAGAHYVVDSLSDILPVLDEIEHRLQNGEKP
jgi:phosphonoacetaldehyde hydrolase